MTDKCDLPNVSVPGNGWTRRPLSIHAICVGSHAKCIELTLGQIDRSDFAVLPTAFSDTLGIVMGCGRLWRMANVTGLIGLLSCEFDADSFVYQEASAGGTTLIQRVAWDSSGPQPAATVYESELTLRLRAAR